MTVQTPVPATSLLTVPFYEDKLFLVEHDGEPYVPIKPIVEALGLAWQPQHRKLKADWERWRCHLMVIPSEGGQQEMVCLPLRKLPSWLHSISLRKVKDERIRKKLLLYQEECDEVLWRYWFEERQAPSKRRPALPETVEERLQLAERIVQGLRRLDLLDDRVRLLYQEITMNALAQLSGRTEPVEGGELWTLEELRPELGISERVWVRVRGRIGKVVKKRWQETRGGKPPKKIRKFVGGSFREVCAYPRGFFHEALKAAKGAIPKVIPGAREEEASH